MFHQVVYQRSVLVALVAIISKSLERIRSGCYNEGNIAYGKYTTWPKNHLNHVNSVFILICLVREKLRRMQKLASMRSIWRHFRNIL